MLVGFTSRWTVFDADALRDNPQEPPRAARGAADPPRRDPRRRRHACWRARSSSPTAATCAPIRTGRLFSHAVGYSFVRQGRAGLERFYDDDLSGRKRRARLAHRPPVGLRAGRATTCVTSLDPAAQRVALQQLAGRKGAVVALDPRTGAIKVMASVPGYDPNTVKDQRAVQRAQPRPGRPAAEPHHAGGLPAGLDVQGRHRHRGHRLGPLHARLAHQRAQRQDASRAFPSTTTRASPSATSPSPRRSRNSVNTVFGEVGEKLGKATMKKYMDRLGFGAPRRGRPAARRARAPAASASAGASSPPPTARSTSGAWPSARTSCTVTPLQMAMVAAAVANGGKLMKPHLGDRIVDRDGRTRPTASSPRRCRRSCRAETASQVGAMMDQVVKEGTGTAAALRGHRRGRQDRHRRGRPTAAPTSCGSSPSPPPRTRASPSPLPWNAGPGSAAPSPPRSPRP